MVQSLINQPSLTYSILHGEMFLKRGYVVLFPFLMYYEYKIGGRANSFKKEVAFFGMFILIRYQMATTNTETKKIKLKKRPASSKRVSSDAKKNGAKKSRKQVVSADVKRLKVGVTRRKKTANKVKSRANAALFHKKLRQKPKKIAWKRYVKSSKNIIQKSFSKLKNVFCDNRKNAKGIVIRERTLNEFLSRHVANRKSYGKSYLRRRHFSRAASFFFGIFEKIYALFERMTSTGIAVFVLSFFICGIFPAVLSAPRAVSVDTRAEWEKGTQNDISTLSENDAIQLKSAGSWESRVWSPMAEPINAGHSSVSIGEYVYVTRGQSDKAFWRYESATDKWEELPDLPQPAYLGADMSYLESTGDIYMIFGGYSRKFYKYSIESKTWTRLNDLLDAPYSGASLENDGTSLYFARGNASTDFYKYDVATDEWLNRAPVTMTISVGGDLVNGQDGFLYALRGTLGTQVYRYDLENNSWAARTAMPAAIAGEQRGAYANGYLYFFRAGTTNTFYRYSVADNVWLGMTGVNEFAPMTTNYSSLSYSSSENKLYGFRGLNTTNFWKFDPTAGTNGQWVGPKQVVDGTIALNTGSDLIWNGQEGASSYIYTVRGGGTNGFYRYDMATNSWGVKANLPYSLNTDIKGTWCNGNLYFLQAGGTGFYRYTEDTWTTLSTTPLLATAGAGAGLACASDNSIYALRGGGNSNFYRYVSGTGWSALPATAIGTTTYYPNIGARIVAIGVDVYAMMGNGETAFLKYSGGAWSEVARTPFAQYLGTDITVYDSRIYAIAGYYKDEFWEYDPALNSWRMLPPNQKNIFGRGPYSGASVEYAGGASFYATPGQGLTDMWSYTESATNFVLTGEYLSQTFDLSHVNNWGSFTVDDFKPANTAITYETRTSNDQNSWSDWEEISGDDIQSPSNRYLQVKITLSSSDGLSTPTIRDFEVSYNSEETAPENPTSINAFSQNGGGQTLISGLTYSYDHPYFQWSGANDGGSGVAGYYVYFGSEIDADPFNEGTFQTALDYSANASLGQTGDNQPKEYYLRIKTKDSDGNVSAETMEAFTYVYGGASPVRSEQISTKEEFDEGSFFDVSSDENFPNNDGSIGLSGISGHWNQSRLSLLSGNVSYGGELAAGNCQGNNNHCLYTPAGGNTNTFYRYEIETDTWSTMTAIPALTANVYYGGSLVEGPPGYLYLAKGYLQSSFLQYDIEANSWTSIDSAPKNFDYGSNLSFDGERYIYAMPGNDDAFYRYDTCNEQVDCTRGWTTLANANFGNPNTVDGQRTYEGSDSVYDGRNNVYVLQGNLLPYFAKYSVENDEEKSESHNTWTTLAPAPEGFYDGGSLAFDEESQVVYAIGGNNAGTANTKQNFYKYDIATNTWSVLPSAPGLVSYGASLLNYDGYLYAQRGGGTTGFYRFNIEDNSWELPTRGFFGPSVPTGNGTNTNTFFPYTTGSYMVSDKTDGIFIIRGGLDNTFGRYDVKNGTFNELAKLPVGTATGASMVYVEDENEIYYSPGNLGITRTGFADYFYKYDVDANVWTEVSSDRPPGQVTTGSSMTYDGSKYIYLTQGGSTAWWRYDTEGTNGTRWSAMTAFTACGASGDGSKILYEDGHVYFVRAGGQTATCRFQIGGAWSLMSALPAAAGAGSDITNPGDGYLYVTRGGGNNDYYRYDLSQALPGSWETISANVDLKVPALVTAGGAASYVDNKNWVISGAGTNSYADGLYSYLVGSANKKTGFAKKGTYETPVMDLISVYHWANLTANYTQPENTFVEFETRTSSDGADWSDWAATTNDNVSGTEHVMTITSQPATFIQIKASFYSSDQVYSPEISDLAVNYYQDTDAPSNPAAISAYSDNTNTVELNSDNWNKFSAPNFVWPVAGSAGGAVDNPGGSGVAGYYVYFGDDANADAFILGEFQTENSLSVSNLTSGKAYYLKIKAVDYANMIPTENLEAFTYKYDIAAPTTPTSIAVTPTGYTAIDSYSFLWATDAADDYSGVAKFQYRTDGDELNVWIDINDPAAFQLTIPNADHIVGAYQSGKNKFYLRTVDGAGNVSNPIVQDYYYSASAPTPPQSLVVNPETSDENEFSFSWEEPASFVGDADKLTYYYSINVLPTANNVVATTLKSAGPGAFATQKDQNTFFVVASDQAGNIEYNNYASVNFHANTAAPGVPGNIQIFDTSDRENSEYSIAIKWIKPEGLDSGNFDGYVIYRSENGTDFSEIAKTTGSAYVDTKLESKVYYYYVKSKDRTNNYSISSTTASIVPTGKFTKPPKLVGVPSYGTQAYQATFDWVTDRVASSFIEYGKTITLGQTTGQVDSVTQHEVITKGLDAGTKYFYRVKYIDSDGNIGTSEIETFTTLDAPIISDVLVTEVSLDDGHVSWKTNVSAKCTLEYGSNTVEESGSNSDHTQIISKLSPSTEYRVSIECIDSDLNSFSSDEYTFRTPEEPIVSDVSVENKDNVDLPTVIVRYKTNVPTKTIIFYKSATGMSDAEYHNDDMVQEHEAEISSLEPAVEYSLSITGIDQYGIQPKPFEQRITTRTDSRPPQVILNRSMGKVSGRGNNAQSNVYIKIQTDENTRVNVFYAKGIVTKSFEQTTSDNIFGQHHMITIPAEAGQVYSYQFESLDDAGNKTLSDPATVPVEQAKANATEVITKTFMNRFGWFSMVGK